MPLDASVMNPRPSRPVPAGLAWLLMRPAGRGDDRGQLPPGLRGFLSTLIRRRRERLPHLITERCGLLPYEPWSYLNAAFKSYGPPGIGSDVELVQLLVDIGGEPADQSGEVALVLG